MTPPHSRPEATTGLVEAFDIAVGLGTVRASDGAAVIFHCTQIADGSRDIAVGTAVDFAVVPGHGGRWEAAALRPAASAAWTASAASKASTAP